MLTHDNIICSRTLPHAISPVAFSYPFIVAGTRTLLSPLFRSDDLFLAFLPQFVDPSQGAAWTQLLMLGLTFVALALYAAYLVYCRRNGMGPLERLRWLRLKYLARGQWPAF